MTSLTSINLSNFNTDNAIDMSYMFCNCYNLQYIDISNFNTKNVYNMSEMFNNCGKIKNLDISSFRADKLIDETSYKNILLGISSSIITLKIHRNFYDKIKNEIPFNLPNLEIID